MKRYYFKLIRSWVNFEDITQLYVITAFNIIQATNILERRMLIDAENCVTARNCDKSKNERAAVAEVTEQHNVVMYDGKPYKPIAFWHSAEQVTEEEYSELKRMSEDVGNRIIVM